MGAPRRRERPEELANLGGTFQPIVNSLLGNYLHARNSMYVRYLVDNC